MRTIPHKHIEPGCIYCDCEHDPEIPCRYIADCMQQEMKPKQESLPSKPEIIRDARGMMIGIKFK